MEKTLSEQTITNPQQNTQSNLLTILRTPAFMVLWASEGLSMIGDRLLMVALITLVYDRTGSAGAVGLLMVFKAIPALLMGSLAGVFVDRWNRKWIMVIANLLQGMLVFWLPTAPGITMICVIYLAMSTINQFFVPARSATIPDLVPAETLMPANSLFALTIVFAIAIGPAIGTWITETVSLNAAFYADAATFLIPAAAVAFLTIPHKRHDAGRFDLLGDLRAGLSFSFSQPVVIVALVTITTAFIIVGTISVSGVVITREILKIESSKFGYLMSGLGTGMLVGAVITNFIKRWVPGPQAGIAGTLLMSVGLMALPLSSNLVTAILIAGVIGLGMIMVQINGQLILQTISPEMRGRLMGISQTLTGSATFFASAAVGLLLEKIPVTTVMWITGCATLVVTIAAAIHFYTTNKKSEPSK
jgi:predicted MFS family arabinose efflux permease